MVIHATVQVTLDVSDECMAARKEAAAKISANRTAIAKRLVTHSGVVRQQGSPYRETSENVNGAHICNTLRVRWRACPCSSVP